MNLDNVAPELIAHKEEAKENFIKVFMGFSKEPKEFAESFYTQESTYYFNAVKNSEELKQCSKISLYSSFMEIAFTGLSIKPCARGEAFIAASSQKIGKDNWVKIAKFTVQAHGELLLRAKAGQITHAFNPIVLYKNDKFQPRTNEAGDLICDYLPEFPRTSNEIVGVFIKLALPNGKYDYKWMQMEDIERLRLTSAKFLKNDKGNALYSSGENGQIDIGFLETKCIKHAFKSYPKIKIGKIAVLEDDEPDQESFSTPENIPNVAPETSDNTDLNETF